MKHAWLLYPLAGIILFAGSAGAQSAPVAKKKAKPVPKAVQAKLTSTRAQLRAVQTLPKKNQATAIAALTSQTFAWTVESKHNSWNRWDQDPSILPLRAIGKAAVPWLEEHFESPGLPNTRGSVANNRGLCITLLGEFGGKHHVLPILRRLIDPRRRQQDCGTLHEEVVRALMNLGSIAGVQYCAEALEEKTPKEEQHRAREALAHVIGDSILHPQLGKHASWLAWWKANRERDVKDWDTGVTMHCH